MRIRTVRFIHDPKQDAVTYDTEASDLILDGRLFFYVLTDFNHLKVFFSHPTFRTNKILRYIFPRCTRDDPIILKAFRLILNPTTNDSLPHTHYLVPQIQIFPPLNAKRGVNYCSLAKKSNIDSSLNQMMER